ncbi:MAG: hypothetical protein HY320_15590 [Armatimonadetes bacterium]|nr:hypothetical protein [Armatimonadota bacterium]
MGMHFGVVAAKASWERFFAELSGLTGRFLDRGRVKTLEEVDFDAHDDGFLLVGGEHEGNAYLHDSSMILSGGTFDRLVELSRRLSCTLAACVGETVSGSFGLLIAENGSLGRLYYNCVSAIREPFSLGTPLAVKSRLGLEDVDGVGLLEALRDQGLDYVAWVRRGSKHTYLYTCEGLNQASSPTRGPIEAAFDEHWKRHEYPKGQAPSPRVVSRVLPDGSMGFGIVARRPGERRKGWLSRLLGR